MPTYLVIGANTMNCDSTTNSASASGPEFEPQRLKFRVKDVTLLNGQNTVRGFSLATLAAALAACGGGGGGGPAPPPPPPPPPPPNNPPTATDASATAVEDGDPATGGAVGADEDGDALTYSVTDAGSLGTLAVADDGSWTYTITDSDEIQALGASATLTDTATIEVSDGEDTATATVTITIQGANDDPTGDDGMGAVTAGMDMAATGSVNAMDVDAGDTHTYAVGDAASYGTLSVDEAGNWSYMVDNSNADVMALDDGETMDDSGTIVITDSAGGSATVSVTVTITGVNDAPGAPDVTASDANFTVAENDTSGVNLAQLTGSDPEGHDITFAVDNDDFEIEVVGNAALLKLKDGASLDFEGSGGSVTLMVTATDSSGATSDPTEVVITVTDVNEAPTSEDGMGAVTAAANMPAMGDVMAMDVDAGDSHTFMVETNGMYGTLTVDDMGAWTYTLDEMNADVIAMPVGATATDTATIVVTDADGLTSMSTVTITITGANEAPTGDDSLGGVTAGSGMPASGNVNGADVDTGDMLSYSVTGMASYGTLEVDDMGMWTYTLDETNADVLALREGGSMEDTGTITIDDGNGGMTPVTVTVFISGNNEAPTISVMNDETPDGMMAYDSISENATGPVGRITVHDEEDGISGPVTPSRDAMGNFVFTDGSGNALTLSVSDDRFIVKEDPEGGLWLVLDEGVDHEMEGTVDVTVTVMDSNHASADATVTITINNVDEAPSIEVVNSVTPDGMPAVNARDENTTGPVGQVMISDPEDDLTEDDLMVSDPRFSVETDAYGGIWLKLDEGVNFEAEESVDVTVTVTDSAGHPAEAVVTVRINDVNETPTISVMDSETPEGDPAVSVIEENTTGPVGLVTVSDEEGMLTEDDITVSDGRFGLMTDAFGGIWLVLNEGIDADMENEVTVTLTVTDAGGLEATTDAVIGIGNVNEAPTLMVQPGVVPAADGGAGASGALDENATGPAYEIIVSDQEDDLTAANVTISDERFEVKTDSEGGLWAFLKEEVNFEEVSSIDITVTVTDSGGLTAMSSHTVTIRDVNDPPAPNQMGVVVITSAATEDDPQEDEVMQNLNAQAGTGVVQMTLDLDQMFSDEDGDTNFRYHLENGPDWLQLVNVQYGSDGSVTGQLVGTVPAGTDTSAFDVMLVATDEDGGRGFALFNIIVDDGNDDITAINLTNPNGTANAFKTVDIPENAAGSGFVIGTLTAEDDDNPRHPNGTHTFEVAPAYQAQFEIVKSGDPDVITSDDVWTLKVKDDVMLDFEAGATIEVGITAKDLGGNSLPGTVSVNVMDNNDAPTVKNAPGNWWVTVDEDLNADDAEAGQWLTFSLETGDDLRALFEDKDANETLTYSIVSGPAWLEINGATLQNAEGMVPERGVYDVTVRATDKEGESADAMFQIAVVLSDPNDADNDEPDITSDGMDIDENPAAGTVVGTITVEDEDLDVAGIHPWGDVTVTFVARTDSNNDGTINASDDALPATHFELVETGRNLDSINYELRLTEAGAMAMDAEAISEVEVTVTAYDGTVADPAAIDANTSGADIDDFDFEIDDVNEAPAYSIVSGEENRSTTIVTEMGAHSYAVEQQHAADTAAPIGTAPPSTVHTIYLNLSKLFEDPDEDHDDGDVTFSASLNNVPWLKMARHWNEDTESMTTGVVKWEDISGGRDEDTTTTDDNPNWPTGAAPDPDDWVLILEVDRNGMDGDPAMADASEIGQDENGLISIVATDEDGASSTTNIAVTITDENLNPRADGSEAVGVSINDTTPHEKQTLVISFDDSVDPDFTGPNKGSPVAVIYQVLNVDGTTSAETVVATSVKTSQNPNAAYEVKQSDVGDEIQGKVFYFEQFGNNIVPSEGDNAALETNTGTVLDRQDPASGTFVFSTATDTLVAAVTITDADGFVADGTTGLPTVDDGDPAVADANATFTWQSSVNGRGGWQDFADDDDTTPLTTMIPDDEQGKFVRLVITFNDNNGVSERVVSDPIKVGDIDTITTLPTIDNGATDANAPVGRTLRVDGLPDNSTVEWLDGDMVIGTGETFTVTTAQQNAGAANDITIRVTTKDASGNVVSIVTQTTAVTVPAGPANSGPISPEDTHTIDLGAAPAMDGTLVELDGKVDMASLFEDVEGGLTFAFADPAGFVAQGAGGAGLGVYLDANGDGSATDEAGDQLLIIDAEGNISYYGTKAQGHNSDNTADGAGNWITTVLTATDAAAANATDTVTVQLRIDAAPTGFEVGTDATTDPTTAATALAAPAADYEAQGATLTEEITVTATGGVQNNPQVAARIDVQDLNQGSHAYGQYTFTVDDDRFEVVAVPAADGGDGSQGILRVKTGQKIDFDSLPVAGDPPDPTANRSLELVVTATPDSGNFDPITIRITVTVVDDTDDNPPAATPLGNNMVPGLKDDETTDNTDDDTEDDDTSGSEDDDEDGGTPAPMDALSGFVSVLDDGMF